MVYARHGGRGRYSYTELPPRGDAGQRMPGSAKPVLSIGLTIYLPQPIFPCYNRASRRYINPGTQTQQFGATGIT
jgi:hypothetical protein